MNWIRETVRSNRKWKGSEPREIDLQDDRRSDEGRQKGRGRGAKKKVTANAQRVEALSSEEKK